MDGPASKPALTGRDLEGDDFVSGAFVDEEKQFGVNACRPNASPESGL
jgi:hypothetical protein